MIGETVITRAYNQIRSQNLEKNDTLSPYLVTSDPYPDHIYHALFVIFENQHTLELSSAIKYRWRFMG